MKACAFALAMIFLAGAPPLFVDASYLRSAQVSGQSLPYSMMMEGGKETGADSIRK